MSSGSLGGLSQQSSSNIQSSSQSGGAQSSQQAGEAFASAYQQSLKQSEEDTKVASKDDVEKESLEKEQKVLNETGEGRVQEDDDVPLSTQLQNIQQKRRKTYFLKKCTGASPDTIYWKAIK